MSALKATSVNKKQVAKAKPNKEIKTKCDYAIICNTSKAIKLFNDGKPVLKGKVLKDGTENEFIEQLFSQCTKNCCENGLCKTHLTIQEKGEKQFFLYSELQKNSDFDLIQSSDDDALQSKRGPKGTPKKNKITIHPDIIEDTSIYIDYIKEIKEVEAKYLQKLNKKNYDSIEKEENSTPIKMVIEEKPSKKKSPKKEIVVQEEVIEEEVQEEYQDVVESDDENEETDFNEIETQDGSQYYYMNNDIYDEDKIRIGSVIEVNDENAPFEIEGDYYCVFENIEFKDKEHFICKISNRVYFNIGSEDEPEYKYQGIAKFKKNGDFNGIKK